MIRVVFNKPNPSVAFDDWLKRGAAAAKKMKGTRDVSSKLYKEQRQVFLDLFNGKCAYCEAKIVLDQHNGDVEHYRPKGRVTDENDRLIEIDDGHGGKRPHPGYYWLAYDSQNLLPSCISCNRPKKSGDRRLGKWNRFPVAGNYACTPAEIAQEKPLLLNPLIPEDDPAQHLEFDPETGRIIGTTDRGRMTVLVLDLNRDGLQEERRKVYDSARALAVDAFAAEMDKDYQKLERYLHYLIEHKKGRAAYSMVGRPIVARYLDALSKQAKRLTEA